ncbi:MAG: linear amide C-N hydrolase [Lentisphaeria bacterium]|nr:linear amide C-N hydrolase [Lentisphaeria bacterium]
MQNKTKKRLKHVLILTPVALVLILAVVALGAWHKFGAFVVAARSIHKLQDGLYVMEYRGDYGLDEFLAQGGADSDSAVADYLIGFLSGGYYRKADNEIKPGDFGCTTVCVKDQNGAVYFGRNFDWKKGRAMIVHTVPEDGYESLSTCDLDFLGFGDDYTPDGSMQERIQTLAAIYVPLDGMNEKGLVIADLMAGDDEETHQKTDKPDLTTTTAIRLLLDRAANVDEAVELLKQYDMNSSIGAAHHFAIADKTGKSVVVEYVNGEMLVAETNIVTNHYLADSPKKGVGDEESHARFDLLNNRIGPDFVLAGWRGRPDYKIAWPPFQEVRALVAPVSQSQKKFWYPQAAGGDNAVTLWSIVYAPEKQWADFYFREDFDHGHRLFLHPALVDPFVREINKKNKFVSDTPVIFFD